MKAALWYGRQDLRVMEVPNPVPANDEVVIKVMRCGICGTDIHDYEDGPHSIPVDVPDPLTGVTAPVIMGHELCGIVTEVGKDVDEWKIGDRVVVAPLLHCGKCYFCNRGLEHLCVIQAGLGLQTYWGGFAEYCCLKDYQLRHMPDYMTWDQGALVEPTNLAMYAIKRSGMQPGDNILITGGGPIALMILMCANAAGAGKVYMTEKHDSRMELMKKHGATEIFNITKTDPLKEILERTNGIGVDVAFEVTGSQAGMDLCFDALRKRGMYVQYGLALGERKVRPWQWTLKDLNMCGLWCTNNYDYDGVVQLVADKKIDSTAIVTKHIALDDVVTEGFECLKRGSKKTDMKILVCPNGMED